MCQQLLAVDAGLLPLRQPLAPISANTTPAMAHRSRISVKKEAQTPLDSASSLPASHVSWVTIRRQCHEPGAVTPCESWWLTGR